MPPSTLLLSLLLASLTSLGKTYTCPEESLDFHDRETSNDIVSIPHMFSWQECGTACTLVGTCFFWTYDSTTLLCHMSRSDHGVHYREGVISGARGCTQQEEQEDFRLIIVGGQGSSDSVGTSVETYPPSSSLSIPPLPESRYLHSLTLLPGPPSTLVVCGGTVLTPPQSTDYRLQSTDYSRSCISYTGGQEGWQEYASMKHQRHGHSAARLGGEAILLMGGGSSGRTAVLVPGGGEFDLQHYSDYSCAVSVEDAGEVVLIGGGYPPHGHVSRYSSTGFLGSLPDLRQKRWRHACGAFTTSRGEKMLLVTGGSDGSSSFSSTELISLTSPTAWTPAASLPQAIIHPSVASLPGPAGGLYLAGGYDGSSDRDEVLRYDEEMDAWEQVGKMADARRSFGMVGADLLSQESGVLTP